MFLVLLHMEFARDRRKVSLSLRKRASLLDTELSGRCPRAVRVLPGRVVRGDTQSEVCSLVEKSLCGRGSVTSGGAAPYPTRRRKVAETRDASAACLARQVVTASSPAGEAWAAQRSRGLLRPSSSSSSSFSSSLYSAPAVGRSCVARGSSSDSR